MFPDVPNYTFPNYDTFPNYFIIIVAEINIKHNSFKYFTVEKLYCVCRQPYDQIKAMIKCDNKKCLNEWFHLSCVGIIKITPEIKKSIIFFSFTF